jgi:hypothetical protein
LTSTKDTSLDVEHLQEHRLPDSKPARGFRDATAFGEFETIEHINKTGWHSESDLRRVRSLRNR